MRHSMGIVFDETVTMGTQNYTSTMLNALLASADMMAIQVVVDDLRADKSETVMVEVAIETSADGVYWAKKSAGPEVAAFTVYPGTSTCSPHAFDTSDLPSLKHARLRVLASSSLTGSIASAHVQVFVTLRDRGLVPEKPVDHPYASEIDS